MKAKGTTGLCIPHMNNHYYCMYRKQLLWIERAFKNQIYFVSK